MRIPTWRVGQAASPLPEDPMFSDEQQAIARAGSMAEAYGFTTAIAVWDDRDEPQWLFMLGEQFKRV